jgi:phosphopantetheinyl transferase (holo-ACP synthase)
MLKRFGAETEYQARMAGSWEVKEKALKAMDTEHRYYERRFGGPRT